MSGTRGEWDLNDKVTSIIVRPKKPFRAKFWMADDKDGAHCAISDYGNYNRDWLADRGFNNDQLTIVTVDGNADVVLYNHDNQSGYQTLIRGGSTVNLKDRRRGDEFPNDHITSIQIRPTNHFYAFVSLYVEDPPHRGGGGWHLTGRGLHNVPGHFNDEFTWVMIDKAPNGITLYEHSNGGGRSIFLGTGNTTGWAGYHNLKQLDDWNDEVSSIRIH